MKWISVKDQLPEIDIDVLIIRKSGGIYIAFRYDSKCHLRYLKKYKAIKETQIEWASQMDEDFNCDLLGDPITHWMPLPERMSE